MFVAQDEFGNRIYADYAESSTLAFCPECGEVLVRKAGKINRPYFSHKIGTDCKWGSNKDNKSEWHIRMQSYFPREYIEYRFTDSQTGEIHIADVYIPAKEIVIEFQKSAISEEEFLSRTIFHLNKGRKIAWVFDESKENCADNEYGRLRLLDPESRIWPYTYLKFRWMRRPRKCLEKGPDLNTFQDRYSILIYAGCEGDDVIRRIVSEDFYFEEIILSIRKTMLAEPSFNCEELFYPEEYWYTCEPVCSDIKRHSGPKLLLYSDYSNSKIESINNIVPRTYSRRRFRF